ncbi:hypothetical protein Tco_0315524 [Tanacetum coccineum]
MICCGPFVTKLAKRLGVLTDEVLDGLSAPIYYRQLDDITLRELIGSNGRLIPDDPQLGVPRGVFESMAGHYGVPLQGDYAHPRAILRSNISRIRSSVAMLRIQRISLTMFPTQSIGSSNTDVLDSPCLLVLIIGTSQSRQHVSTSLIHIESCKSPTAELFEVDSRRISIRHCEY